MDNSRDQASPVTEADIQAYVDGELPPSRRAQVSAYLAAHPDEAARVAAYQQLNLELHRQYPLDREPALTLEQAELAEQLSRAAGRPKGVARTGVRLVAGVAVIAIAMVAGWQAYDRYLTPEPPLLTFAERAGEAHRLFARNAEPASVAAGEDAVSTDVADWLSEHSDETPIGAPPDLTDHGFELLRGRIVEGATAPSIQLLYRDTDGEGYLSLIVGRSADDAKTSFSFVEDGDLSLFYWQQGRHAFAISSRLGRDALLEIAELVSAMVVAGEKADAAPSADPPLSEAAGSPIPAPAGAATVVPSSVDPEATPGAGPIRDGGSSGGMGVAPASDAGREESSGAGTPAPDNIGDVGGPAAPRPNPAV